MRVRYQIIWTLIIQGIGASALLVATILIGSTLGPEQQGLFSRTKSEIEFVSSLSLLGMQQSVFYFVASGRLRLIGALRWLSGMCLLGFVVASVYVVIIGKAALPFSALFAFVTVILVMHGMLRLLVLAYSTTRYFSLVTALPQLLVLLGVLILVDHGSIVDWQVVATFSIAFLSATAISITVLRQSNTRKSGDALHPVGRAEVLRYGLAAGAWALLSRGSILYWINQIEIGSGLAAVGIWTMALVVVQVFLTPFQYASPLFFKVLAESSGLIIPNRLSIVSVGRVILCVGGIAFLLSFLAPSIDFGAYEKLMSLSNILVLLVMTEVTLLILVTVAGAAGQSWIPAVSESTRFLTLLATSLHGYSSTLPSAAVVWLLASASAAITAALCVAFSSRP